MINLSVFSHKLNRPIKISATSDNLIFDNVSLAWLDNGWNNTDSWMDKGWNNTSNWMDKGWNNTSSWTDKGWNDTSSWTDNSWSDSSKWTDISSWNNSSSWSDGSSCFITTACVNIMGKNDDCYELELLRLYRDKLCKSNDELRELALDYYKNAPVIIEKIKLRENAEEIFADIYENCIKKCVSLFESGNIEGGVNCYKNMYFSLKDIYLN